LALIGERLSGEGIVSAAKKRPPKRPRVDPIDHITGESLLPDGRIPPRQDDLSTPSYGSLPTEELWKEIARVRPIAVVAFRPSDQERGVFRGQVYVSADDLRTSKMAVLAVEGVRALDNAPEHFAMPSMAEGREYPAMLVEFEGPDALDRVRTLEVVDFVEPVYFLDGIGCGSPHYQQNPNDEFFEPVPNLQPPKAVAVSWNYRHMGIQDAWGLFPAPGAPAPGGGVTIGVVDTGVDPGQVQLNQNFALPPGTRGPSVRLTIGPDATVPCSHGTRMAGLATAPADGGDPLVGNYVGIAWGAGLVSAKIGNGVVHTDTSTLSIISGLSAAIGAGASVITMAFGMPFVSNLLRDWITMIFDDYPRVLLVAAAGTNETWVVFPASMDREVTAASIVDFSPTPTAPYQKYAGLAHATELVAYGPSVDFVAVNGPGDIPTTGFADDPVVTLGGSSSGTSMIAAIAAIAWSRQPQFTRADLITQLILASNIRLIEGQQTVVRRKSSEVGYGIPDAYVAAGGARRASILGPQTVPPGAGYSLTAHTDGVESFFTYEWDSGETTKSINAVAGANGTTRTHTVTVRNSVDGAVLMTSLSVTYAGAHFRRVFSTEVVAAWATFLNGAQVDKLVGVGAQLPVGCSVIEVLGHELSYSNGHLVPLGSPVASKDNHYNGFTVARLGGIGASALDALAHVWHDGASAIHVRVVYDVWEPDGTDCTAQGMVQATP